MDLAKQSPYLRAIARALSGAIALLSLVSLDTACGTQKRDSSPQAGVSIGRSGGSPTATALAFECTVDLGSEPALKVSTAPDCGDHEGASCSLGALALAAEATGSSRSGALVARWSITRDEETLVVKTVSVAGGSTTTQIDFGPAFGGAHRLSVRDVRGTLTGTIDGRAMVPVEKTHPQTVGGLELADHGPAPTLRSTPGLQEAIYRVLDKARVDIPAACGGAGRFGPAGSLTARTVGNLLEALTHASPPSDATPPPHRSRVELLDQNANSGWATPASPLDSLVGPNDLVTWVTPACQACAQSCSEDPVNWFLPGAKEICIASCFIPGNGCGQEICDPSAGIASCDGTESCCTGAGQSLCCPKNSACGTVVEALPPSRSWPICCPSDFPVACGDEYQQACYPGGSSCCGGGACSAGNTCLSDPTYGPTCCATAQVCGSTCCDSGTSCQQTSTGGNVCCATPLCSDQCCGPGSQCDANGVCCYGPTDGNGSCCGYGSTVCNGQCCSGSCAADGSCCPAGSLCSTGALTISGPNPASVGVTYTLSGAYNGAPISSWQWSVINASGVESPIGSGQSVSWTPTVSDAGTETLKLVATDVNGQQVTTTAAVLVLSFSRPG